MRVFSNLGQLEKIHGPVVAAVGVFDGVHLGHQAVIGRAVEAARKLGGSCVVVTFHPHPRKVVAPHKFSACLVGLDQRLEAMKALGVDAVFVVSFNRRLAALRPEDFIQRYLVNALCVRKVVVGEDFHFGHDRAGSVVFLKKRAKQWGFSLESRKLLRKGEEDVKTSLIKQMVAAGDVARAGRLMGRPFAIRGEVVHGDARGKRLGFPTANIRPGNVIIPAAGIYIARVVVGGQRKNALLYVGRRPSFKGANARIALEACILDYRGSLYGREITVDLLQKIRDDRRFSDEASLVRQIAEDEKKARAYFIHHPA